MPRTRARATRIISRQAELQELNDLLDRARAGVGQVVFVAGEAGIGKTRLIRAFRESIRTIEGVVVLHGQCDDEDPAVPYGSFIDALRTFLHVYGPDTVAEAAGPLAGDLAKLLPELVTALPSPHRETDPQTEKRRLFEAIHRVLQPRAASACYVIVLEDLHWADQTSQELVHYLARVSERDCLLILSTYRSEELQSRQPLAHLIGQLTRERRYHEIALEPLSRHDMAAMVEDILGQRLPDAVVGLLYDRTGGNPFFVEEILQALIAEGRLDALVERARHGGKRVRFPIPLSLKESILSRTRDLDGTTSAVLSYAAVIGRRFDFALLQFLTGLEEEVLVHAVTTLVGRQLVVEEVDGVETDRYAFRHALTREAIYEELLGRERRLKHRAILWALEVAHPSDRERVADQLAYHSLQAGEREQAFRYAQLAGARAARMSAYREAVAHYEVALELLESDDPRVQAELYDALAEAAYPLGDTDVYLHYWQEAQRRYEHVGDRRMVADIHRRLGQVEWERGELAAAFDHTRAAVTALESEPPGRELAMAYSALSQLYMLSSSPRESIMWGEKALGIADELDDAGIAAHALNNLGCSRCQLGETARGIAELERSLALGKRVGLTFDAIRACLNLGDVLNFLGEFRRASDVLTEGIALAEHLGWQSHSGQLMDNLATASMELGDWDQAHTLLDRIIRMSDAGTPIARLFAMRTKGELLRRQGRLGDARQLLEEILPQCEAHGGFQLLGQLWLALAHIHLAFGDSDRAVTMAARCIERWTGILIGADKMLGDSIEIYLAAGQQQETKARKYLEDLSALVTPTATRLAQARLEDARGLFAAHEDRRTDAAEDFQRAIALWSAMVCPYQEARSRRHRAESLLHRRDGAAREEAGREFAAARETFDRLGAVLERDGVDSAVKRYGLAGRIARGASVLSPREREVLTLIARGYSNREIAQELFISQKTAEIHVGNILTKLNCASRTQAAALAIARGLVSYPDA